VDRIEEDAQCIQGPPRGRYNHPGLFRPQTQGSPQGIASKDADQFATQRGQSGEEERIHVNLCKYIVYVMKLYKNRVFQIIYNLYYMLPLIQVENVLQKIY